LHAPQFEVLRSRHEAGLAKSQQRFSHFRDHLDAAVLESRLVEIGFAVVRREFFFSYFRGGIERGIKRLARVLGEARPLRQRFDVQQFIQDEIEIPAVQQFGLHAGSLLLNTPLKKCSPRRREDTKKSEIDIRE